jgi:hypothetical protein
LVGDSGGDNAEVGDDTASMVVLLAAILGLLCFGRSIILGLAEYAHGDDDATVGSWVGMDNDACSGFFFSTRLFCCLCATTCAVWA